MWNQLAGELDIDSRLREIWRELSTISQVIVGIEWGRKTYRVRGLGEGGRKKRREFKNIRVPTGLTILDPLKVVPVGLPMFNREKLAWMADDAEARAIDKMLRNRASDPILSNLIVGAYKPGVEELASLKNAGYKGDKFYEMNSDSVFRHTVTRPQYLPWPTIRMLSVFELLDLKAQLRQVDRAFLLGAVNFLLLIRKGTDEHPAQPAEIENLRQQARATSASGVMVGDHRLQVEIVTPKMDFTLKAERYDVLDSRISSRLYQMFNLGVTKGSDEDVNKLMKVVARGMESRRLMIRRALERHIFNAVVERNDLKSHPSLRFHPQAIALDFDPQFARAVLDLRASNEISRETTLSQFDMDQADEAMLVERERELYDDIFKTQQPHGTPNPVLQDKPGPDDGDSTSMKNGGGTGRIGDGHGQEPINPTRRDRRPKE
jgi:hypothetical protein